MNSGKFRIILDVIGGTIIISACLILKRYSSDLEGYNTFGFIGVLIVTWLRSTILFFPIPNFVTIFSAAILFNPIGVAIAGGVGSTMGMVISYLMGLNIQNTKDFKRSPKFVQLFEKYGDLIVFLLALITNPIYNLTATTLGLVKYGILKFILFTFIGRILHSFLFAYLGSLLF